MAEKLGSQGQSIRASFGVATVFHDLVKNFIEKSTSQYSGTIQDCGTPDLDAIRFHHLGTSEFLPTPMIRAKIMHTTVTEMSEADYNKCHVPLTYAPSSSAGVGYAMDGSANTPGSDKPPGDQ